MMMEVEKSGQGFETEGEELASAAGASSPPPASATKTQSREFESIVVSPAAVGESLLTGRKWRRALTRVRVVIFQAKINVLLPFGSLAILLHYLTDKHKGRVSLFSIIGITPLSERLGYANEQLAFSTGPTIGGLLNVVFGNATEIIISIYALKNGMIRVVQQSLLGSILSNMLLVLGCAFFAGGIVQCNKDQVFNKASAVISSGLLLMALLGLMFPTVLHFTHTELHYGKSELALSRFSSCIMLVAYANYLFFQLKTRRNIYSPINEEEEEEEEALAKDEKEITQGEAICWIFVLTFWISVLSGYLIDAIEDITLGIAIGSSTRISMFVIPFCVVIGWMMGQQMDLNFGLFETATLFITIIIVAFMLQQGVSNYFKGLVLIFCYFIVAARSFAHVDPDTSKHYLSMVLLRTHARALPAH